MSREESTFEYLKHRVAALARFDSSSSAALHPPGHTCLAQKGGPLTVSSAAVDDY